MLGFLRKISKNKRGNALVLVAGALPLLIGSAGLASDTIQWALWKRQLQRAADSAAIAGVYAQMQSQTVSDAVTTDLSRNNQTPISLSSGYPQITYPSSAYTYTTNVKLGIQQSLAFSSVFLSTAPVITASATAAIVQKGDYCVISLENTAVTGITVTGSSVLNLGCGMITNSPALNAAVATGSSSVIASPIAAVGGIQSSSGFAAGTELIPFTVAEQDPFASVTPTMPSTCGGPLVVNSNKTLDLSSQTTPVCYSSIDVKGVLKLPAGPVYINGGNLTTNSGAVIDGSLGTTIVLSNSSTSSTASIGTVSMNGGAQFKLIAPSSGTFKGIAIYQDRRAVDNSSSSASSPNMINGNSSSMFQGAFYFPSQQVTANGTTGMSENCMQVVARRVYFSGNSAISNVCPANSGSSSFKGQAVRLIA